MRGLFLRIFLWFWLTISVVVAVLVVSSPLLTRSRPGVERWEEHAERFIDRMVGSLEEHVHRHGVRGGRFHGPGHGRGERPMLARIVDADGRDVHGRPVPEQLGDLARKVLSTDQSVAERSGAVYAAGRPVTTSAGARYAVVVSVRRPPRVLDLLDPAALLPRLLALLAIVGGLCFWMARRLTSPLRRLRRAANELGGGRLGVRVGPPICDRRDELGDLARDFDRMADRLERLVGSQRRLLRDVSHELRSPLARLGVALELARDDDGVEREQALDRIELEAARLDEMIGRLLTLSRLESGEREPLDELPVELSELMREIVADAQLEAARRGIEITCRVEERAVVVGDPELLHSALENVVRNAVAHSPGGSAVGVRVGTEELDDGTRVCVVSVTDAGPGVPEDRLQAIFDPFFRLDEARDRGRGGTGLGLAITRAAVEAHGGSVAARNRPEGGLDVTCVVPARRLSTEGDGDGVAGTPA